MAWSTIPSASIDVGDPVKKELMDNIKDNDDDHESRIDALEGTAGKTIIFNETYWGNMSEYDDAFLGNIDIFRVPSDLAIVQAKLTLVDAASTSAGTLEIDIHKSTDGSTYQTIFTTKPSITTNSEGDTSTNAVIGAGSATIASGTYLKLKFSSLKAPQGAFHVDVYGEPA